MLRYLITLMLYEVEEDETFLSPRLVQCAFGYVSIETKLSFIWLWHWCGVFRPALGLLGVQGRAPDVFQLLLRPVLTAKVRGKEPKC